MAEKEPDKHCLISEKVYEIAHKSFTTELVGEISLKGKSKPMKVYNLTSNITCKTPFINLK